MTTQTLYKKFESNSKRFVLNKVEGSTFSNGITPLADIQAERRFDADLVDQRCELQSEFNTLADQLRSDTHTADTLAPLVVRGLALAGLTPKRLDLARLFRPADVLDRTRRDRDLSREEQVLRFLNRLRNRVLRAHERGFLDVDHINRLATLTREKKAEQQRKKEAAKRKDDDEFPVAALIAFAYKEKSYFTVGGKEHPAATADEAREWIDAQHSKHLLPWAFHETARAQLARELIVRREDLVGGNLKTNDSRILRAERELLARDNLRSLLYSDLGLRVASQVSEKRDEQLLAASQRLFERRSFTTAGREIEVKEVLESLKISAREAWLYVHRDLVNEIQNARNDAENAKEALRSINEKIAEIPGRNIKQMEERRRLERYRDDDLAPREKEATARATALENKLWSNYEAPTEADAVSALRAQHAQLAAAPLTRDEEVIHGCQLAIQPWRRISPASTAVPTGHSGRKEDKWIGTKLADYVLALTHAKVGAAIAAGTRPSGETLTAIRGTLERTCQRILGECVISRNMTDLEVWTRMTDPAWWKKRVQKVRRRTVEHLAAITGALGGPDPDNGKYLTADSLEDIIEQDRANEEFMKNAYLSYGEGENRVTRSYAELRANSPLGNPHSRMVELFKRIEGAGELAERQGHTVLFAVLTLESRWHPKTTRNGERIDNPNYDFSLTSTEAHREIGRRWRLATKEAARQNIEFRSLRTVEAQRDSTPHWNVMFFLPPEQKAAMEEILEHHFLVLHEPDEPGAQEHRVRFTSVVPTEKYPKPAQACAAYMAKYIFKNVSFNADGTPAQRTPHDAWASIIGARRWAFTGYPSIGIYRKLREIGGSRPDYLQKFINSDEYAAWPDLLKKAHQSALGYIIEGSLVRKKEHVNFADWIEIMESEEGEISLEFSPVTHSAQIISEAALDARNTLAEALNLDQAAFGPGRYCGDLPNRATHILVTFADKKTALIPLPARREWVRSEWNGEDLKQEKIASDDENVWETDEPTPRGNFQLLVQLFMNNPRKTPRLAAAKKLLDSPRNDPSFYAPGGEFSQILARGRPQKLAA